MFSLNTRYSVKLVLLSLGLFSFFRALTLFLAFKNPLSLPAADILQAFLIALRYDINVLMYVLVPVTVIAHLPLIGAENCRLTRIFISSLVIAVLSLCSFILLVDIEYMRVLGTRFFIADLEYLNDLRDSLEVMVTGFNLPVYLLIWLSVSIIVFWLVRRASRAIESHRVSPPLSAKILGPLVLISVLLTVGLSGFTTLRWGNVYFSEYQKLNELALNGPYVLYFSYRHIKKLKREGLKALQGGSKNEAIKKTRQLLTGDPFYFTDKEDKSVKRELSGDAVFKTYNIVIIIMESFSANKIGALGAKDSLTPYFDRLAGKGLLFTNFYANGNRSNQGLPALLLSYPDYLPGEALMRSIAYRHKKFSSIAELLKKRGYQTYYVTGGRIGFDNQEGFMRKHGFERLFGFADFNIFTESEKKGLIWSVPDEVIFEHAHKTFTGFKNKGQNFLGVVLTLSNHRPYMLPSHFQKNAPDISKEELAFMYSDWALGQFMENAKKSEYFDDTIFVITADTGIEYEYLESSGYKKFHIPLLLFAPDIIKPEVSSTLGSQLDLMPTLIELTGLKAPFEGFGKSLTSDSGTRFLISKENLTYHILQDGLYIKTNFMDDNPRVFDYNEQWKRTPGEEKELAGRILSNSRMFVKATFELLDK